MPALNRVGQLFCHGSAEENIDVADIPFVKGFRWKSFCQLEPEVGFVLYSKGIGEIRGIVGIVIVISSVLLAFRKTFSQMITYGICSIFTFFLCNYLVYAEGIQGASYSYFITMFVLLLFYVINYYYVSRKEMR